MPPQLKQLHDIEGLDPISFWPLTASSWICISVGILVLGLLVYLIVRRIAFMRSWKNDTFQKLD